MSKPILYLSFDVKIDGPAPLVNNLLSIGIVGLEESTSNIVFELSPILNHWKHINLILNVLKLFG